MNQIRSTRASLAETASNLDRFGDSFRFRLPGNKYRHGSVLGCVFTTVVVCTLLLQTLLKGTSLFGLGETKTIRSLDEGYFDTSHVFSSDDGLRFAYGITAYDSDPEIVEDLDYGEVKATFRSWGADIDGAQADDNALKTHPCTEEELGLTGSNPAFWPLHEKSAGDVKLRQKKFKCTDERIEIYGDYNSDKARRLEIQFEKCDNKTREGGTCKSEAEI